MADAHKNFAYSTVATAPSPALSGTSLVVAAGEGALFPAVPFNMTIWPVDEAPLSTNAEIVRVTNISTDTLTITRAQEGTAARTVVVGDQVANTITVKVLTDIETDLANHLSDTSDAHDASAISVVSTTLSGTGADVQAVFEEIDNLLDDHSSRHENGGSDEISIAGLDGVSTELANHLADPSDAHDASAISVVSTTLVGTGTDVQAVFEELDDAIAALTPSPPDNENLILHMEVFA